MTFNRLHRKTYALLASMVFFSSLGNVLLGRGMKEIGEIVDFSPAALAAVFAKTFTNGSIWLGILSLLIFFVSYLLLLSWADLSYVLPVTSAGYVLAAIAGRLFLQEQISTARWTGIALIMSGVVLVGRTAHSTTGEDGR